MAMVVGMVGNGDDVAAEISTHTLHSLEAEECGLKMTFEWSGEIGK